jgi:UDP-N-acetylmuramoyl-L-alanyl-D-glutamate--2,6-diaminopimelate ligase
VLNLDDEFGVALARRLAGRVRTIGYSLAPVEAAADEKIVADAQWRLPVLGRFNVSNALGVLGCLVARGVPLREGAELLRTLPPVPGRMQRVADAPLVVVDYAHTPDALEKVLQALRPVAAERGGKLAVVFGAGGDRDPTKRAPMGAAAARFADRVVVTSDNPRGEEPLAIISQIEKGIPGRHEVEADRARAIAGVIAAADPNDVVLIAGKGHEDYQEIAGRRTPFSDAAVARAAVAARGSK